MVRPADGDGQPRPSPSLTRRLAAATLAVLAAVALYATQPAEAWQPLIEPPTDQQRLEKLDRDLLPAQGAIEATLGDLGTTPQALDLEAPYLTILQKRAIQGWEIVRAAGWMDCAGQYLATLRVGFASLADSVDSYRGQDPAYATEFAAGLMLIGPKADLERTATTCGPETAEPTPTPVAS